MDKPSERWDKEENENDEKWNNYWKNNSNDNDLTKKIQKLIDHVDFINAKLNTLQLKQEFLMTKLSELGSMITILENEIVYLKDKL